MDNLPSSDDEDRLTLQILVDPPSPSPSVTKASSPVSIDDEVCKPKEQSVASDDHESDRVDDDAVTVKSKTEEGDEGFSWSEYMRETKSKAAPPDCFFQDPKPPVNNFKAQMKIEVPDLRGNGTQCLATIQHVHCVWICVRLDGEDTSNDHWMICDDRSILPVGANKKKGNPIQPPYGYKYNISGFHKFIENQLKPNANGESPAAPPNIFKPIPSSFHPQKNKFEVGMKCEAVDYKNFNGRPSPATIVEVEDDYVTINFDGWNNSYNLKMRYDSRYLFPVGWSAKNGLAINPPQKTHGRSKYGSVRKETNQKSASHKQSSQSPLCPKNKALVGKQANLKKRKTTPSATGPPRRKFRANHRRRSSTSVSSSSQKTSSATGSAATSSVNLKEIKDIKKENHILSNLNVASSSNERLFTSEALRNVLPLQRPVARKTIPNPPVQQTLAKSSPVLSRQQHNVRSYCTPVKSASSVVGIPNAAAIHSSSQSSSIGSVNSVPSQPPLSVASSSSSSLDASHIPLSKQAFSEEKFLNNNLRLLAPKPKNEFNSEISKAAFVTTNVPAPDILLTAGDRSMSVESSKMTVYINRSCNCSPVLDRKKVKGLPSQIGPGSHHHVFRETIQQIVNCAIDNKSVFNEIKPAPAHILSITTSLNGVTNVRALPILRSSLEAWDRLNKLLSKLKICPNFLREVEIVCQNCNSKSQDDSHGESSDSGRSSHPHLSESGDSVSSGDYSGGDEGLRNWSVEKVAGEIETAFDPTVASRFRQNQIDGQALMLLSTDLLMQYLEMPFGPALKMVNFVDNLKKKYR